MLPPAKHQELVALGVMLTIDRLQKEAVLWADLHGVQGPGVTVSIPNRLIPPMVKDLWDRSDWHESTWDIWDILEAMAGNWNALRHLNPSAQELLRHAKEAIYSSELVATWLDHKDKVGPDKSDIAGEAKGERIQNDMKNRRRYLRTQIIKATLGFLAAQRGGEFDDFVVRITQANLTEIRELVCPNKQHGRDRKTIVAEAALSKARVKADIEALRRAKSFPKD